MQIIGDSIRQPNVVLDSDTYHAGLTGANTTGAVDLNNLSASRKELSVLTSNTQVPPAQIG